MNTNILITGAAGYIGGSLVTDLMSYTSGPISAKTKVYGAVRSQDQVQGLSKKGINAILLDLHDEKAVHDVVLQKEIDIIFNPASSYNPQLVSNLIQALGDRRKVGRIDTYFIQCSTTTMFSEDGGWPYGEVRDTDPLFEKEKQIEGQHPVRQTNILIVEKSKELGVTSFNVAVPTVYGRGTGQWRKLSVNIPAHIRTSIEHKTVYKFDKDGNPPAAHISDLTALCSLILEKILLKQPIPSGEDGYYFAMAHRVQWWEVMSLIAKRLHARGLVDEPTAKVWPSYEMAAEYLEFPLPIIRGMGTSTGDLVPLKARQIGWEPKWSQERFLESIDDEISAVQELDTVKPTLFAPFLNTNKSATA